MSTGADHEVERVGFFTPKPEQSRELGPGEIGFLTAGIKDVADTKIGDTITDDRKPACAEPLPGFKPSVPVVFCGLFPIDAAEYPAICARAWPSCGSTTPASISSPRPRPRWASASAAASSACLHLEIIQERLEREFNLDLITTAPSVVYQHPPDQRRDAWSCTTRPTCPTRCASTISRSPGSRPPSSCPTNYLGPILKLCEERRGMQVELNYVGTRAMLIYNLPLNEVVYDFYDRLKSVQPRLCQLRLSPRRLSDRRSGEAVDPGEWRAGRCAVDDRPPRPCRGPRPRACASG